MEKVYIYTLEDPITNQIRYVGKANNLEKRYKDHLNSARDKGTHKRNWINKLKKEGLKPIINEIDFVLIDEWQFWEKYWYYQLLTWNYDLVNHTTCGEGLTFGNKTSFKLGHGKKEIVALNLDGTFYSEFNSIKEASNLLNISSSNISSVLTKITKTAGKYIWMYINDYLNLTDLDLNKILLNINDNSLKGGIETRFKEGNIPWNKDINYTKKGKIVQQFDLQMNFINEYISCVEAANHIKGNQDSISSCCRGKNKTSKGFIWKYKENLI